MVSSFTKVFSSVSEGTCVRYSEGEQFIPNPPFRLSRPYLVILNNPLRVLIIIDISRTMAGGDTGESIFWQEK